MVWSAIIMTKRVPISCRTTHASMLLDRHHQPSASHARTLRQSVYQHTNFNREDSSLREEDENEGIDGHYVSNLGESFVSTRLEDENQVGDSLRELQGGGVIDLLRQFQRAP